MRQIVQLDLLGGPSIRIDVDPRHVARRSDPSVSHQAAARVNEFAGNHKETILAALKKFGKAGAEQIAGATRLDAYSVRKRLADLEHDGLARPTTETRLTVTGRQERIWSTV